MSLSTSWALYFDSRTKMRGRAYCTEGRVSELTVDAADDWVRAKVSGEEQYEVQFCLKGDPDEASCTCPHFEGGNFCKHLWAAVLYLEEHRPDLLERLDESNTPSLPKARKRSADRPEAPRGDPEWLNRLNLVRSPAVGAQTDPAGAALQPSDFLQVCYVIDPRVSRQRRQLAVELHQRRLAPGGWSKLKRLKIDAVAAARLPEPEDRELCSLLVGADWVARNTDQVARLGHLDRYEDLYDNPRSRSIFGVDSSAWWAMLRRFVATGRCFVDTEQEPVALSIDDRLDRPADQQSEAKQRPSPWTLWLVGEMVDNALELTLELRRGEQRMPIDRPDLLLGDAGEEGIVIYDGQAAHFDDRQAFRWVSHFRDDLARHDHVRPIVIPHDDIPRFLDRLYLMADLPEIELPPGIGRGEQQVDLVPQLEIATPPAGASRKMLSAQVWFAYGSHRIEPGRRGRFVAPPHTRPPAEQGQEVQAALPVQEGPEIATEPVPANQPLIRRQLHREQSLYASLLRAGFSPGTGAESDRLFLPVRQMPLIVSQLLEEGWTVAADAKVLRHAGAPRLSVSSGIDWFELRGDVTFETEHGEQTVSLPQILRALKAGKNTVRLDDGSEGLLPQDWLAEHGLLTGMGKLHDDHLRFRSSQAALLDALLARQEQVVTDDAFAQIRERLHQFQGIEPLEPAPTFMGQLRPYQREGLGWFQFLRWFGMGGILADDMGLGKTIQILAMLDDRYSRAKLEQDDAGTNDRSEPASPHRPTLIVVPRSVVFNWMDEADKFAPQLRVQAYTGTDRHALRDAFADHDVIITSYGLLRRDIEELRQHTFDYVVLDEAQAIKNPASQSAKSARLLRTEHRLALTGTPVENHIGDLWSIFEFLNPGMLGSSTRFGDLLRHGPGGHRHGQARSNGATTRQAGADAQIARALRPFILRRTKQQVLNDLPEKTEQTIHCEMEPAQRAVYDELRRYYRQTLLSNGRTTSAGEAPMGMQPMIVLEALLRLRQAACHPALIDQKHADEPSAKMEVLLDRIGDLVEEGHKALVFSQFTSMLALVRKQLDRQGVRYAYLDGQTRQRKQVVDEFQNDPTCPVFLISLKAGGFGLNLTAAEYVFILDPWWNPAVEAQAIDRTHRIGQTQHVFAYRLICEDTVEQRILELQDKKKKLADAIVGGQENLLRSLTRDDLERLLS